jgi:Na+-driven multidrug efflux pump
VTEEFSPYPHMAPIGEPTEVRPAPPAELHRVVQLLLLNLILSIGLTVVVLLLRHSVIEYQVSHAHLKSSTTVSAAEQRRILRASATAAVYSRIVGNVVVAVVYYFLVRSLMRGKRRAYRRVLWLSIAGIASLGLLWTQPYPAWMRLEQVGQGFVLAAILYQVTRPQVRAFFAKPNQR